MQEKREKGEKGEGREKKEACECWSGRRRGKQKTIHLAKTKRKKKNKTRFRCLHVCVCVCCVCEWYQKNQIRKQIFTMRARHFRVHNFFVIVWQLWWERSTVGWQGKCKGYPNKNKVFNGKLNSEFLLCNANAWRRRRRQRDKAQEFYAEFERCFSCSAGGGGFPL